MARVLSALVLLPIVLGTLLWLPPEGTLVLALLVLVPAVWELAHLAERGHAPLPRWLMLVAGVTTLLSVSGRWVPSELSLLAALVAVGSALVGEARPEEDVLRRVGVMLLPILYISLPLGAMVVIRRDYGPWMLIVLVATTIVSDTAQYYGGRSMGRRKLAPRISPNKTIEGALAGMLAGSLVLPLAGPAMLPGAPWWLLWPVGVGMVGFGIVGDLFESLLKRSAHAKDSSGLIPGHGGILDRIDSLLFASPFYYGFLEAVGHAWRT